MCGLVAIHTPGRGLEARMGVFDAMLACIIHRGPDGEEKNHIPGQVLFGHRRLSIINAEHGSQPSGKTKHILKKAVRNLLPGIVLDRKHRMGFPVQLGEWMRGGVARVFFRDTLLSFGSLQRGISKPKALKSMTTSQCVGGRQLFGALGLELSHRRFIDAA